MRRLIALLLLAIAATWLAGGEVSPAPPAGPDRDGGSTALPRVAAAQATALAPVAPTAAAPTAADPSAADPILHESPRAAALRSRRVAVHDDAGRPIAGAQVVVGDDAEHDLGAATTDPAGSASVPDDARATLVRASAPGFTRASARLGPAEPTVVVLHAAPRVSGRVFGADELPLAGARVVLSPIEPERDVAMSAVTARDGGFDVPCPGRDRHELRVTAPGHAPHVALVPAAAAAGLAIRLVAEATITGIALRADGAPLPGAAVHAFGPAPPSAPVRTELGPLRPQCGALLATARADGAGRFHLAELPPGPAIVALGVEFAFAHAFVECAPHTRANVELRAPQLAELHGHVADARGHEVVVYGGPGLLRSARTDGGGGFVVHELPPGRYLVGATEQATAAWLHGIVQEFVVHGRTSFATTISLAPGERRAVELSAIHATLGEVRGAATIGGRPAAGFRIVLTNDPAIGASRRTAFVADDGSFAIDGVPPGDYSVGLHALDASAAVVTAACRVRIGGTALVTLTAP